MTLARLLATALLFCSLALFAQEPLPGQLIAPGNVRSTTPAPTPSEPWRIIPDQPLYGLEQNSPDSMRVDRFKADPDFNLLNPAPETMISSEAQRQSDTTCFAIRSYVMARDNKESDSTHPVRYSTCQPASQYHVKNAEGPALRIRR